MNILIVTPFYKQDRCIGSVRWTNLAQRLAKKHKVIVVAQPLDDMDMAFSKIEEDGLVLVRLNQKTFYEKIAVKHFHGATGEDLDLSDKYKEIKNDSKESVLRKLKNRILYFSMSCKAEQYASFILKKVIPNDMRIDVVISSACPFIEMLFGYEIKKRLGCKWICDFRDLPFQEDNCDSTHIEKNIMEKSLSDSDAISVVAPCMKQDLLNWFNLDDNKIHVITNGFSMKDKRVALSNNDGVLHLVHTGSLYGGSRRADLLFAALKRIQKEGYDEAAFEVAGGNNISLVETSKKYDCFDIINDYGFISRDEALELQLRADCLVALVEPFSLPAKMFEYVLNQKPIICIVMAGDYSESQAKPFIESLNVGTVYEENNWDKDVIRLANYLKTQIDAKRTGREIDYLPNEDEVKKYDHDNLTLQVENIILGILAE